MVQANGDPLALDEKDLLFAVAVVVHDGGGCHDAAGAAPLDSVLPARLPSIVEADDPFGPSGADNGLEFPVPLQVREDGGGIDPLLRVIRPFQPGLHGKDRHGEN